MAGHGSPPPEDRANHPNRNVQRLRSDVTRTRNRIDSIAMEYGAHDIPSHSPMYPKMQQAKAKHRSAVQALNAHERGS